MRSKRLLAMLLVICLVFANLGPAAFAVEAPADNIVNAAQRTESTAADKATSSPFANGNVLSGEDVAANEKGISTLKDNTVLTSEIVEADKAANSYDFNAVEAPENSVLNVAQTPECFEELKKAAEVYARDEVVTAFVVMEDAALAERYSSIAKVAASDENALLKVQNKLISQIEKTVLKGSELKVRYQFTYLTNAFTIETEFENLEKIAVMDGVKSVFIAPVYEAIPTNEATASPNTASAGKMTGVHQVWQDLGYTGVGMKIAVIDTGLDLDHPSFAAEPAGESDDYMTEDDVADVLEELNAYKRKSSITADDLYRSKKVPYAFNYCDNNLTADHSADSMGDHGTHVSGIAAANPVEGTTVVGMAPDAQIIVMKVFGANGGAYTDDIVAALEDAMTLGCDVVNLSLGSSGGFSSEDPEIDMIYERLNSQDIIATISAGNEDVSSTGNMWGTDLNRTQNPDNATIGQPGTYANATTIASANNAEVPAYYFTLADGQTVFYVDPYEYIVDMQSLAGQELEYVAVDGLGEVENFYDEEGNSLVEGKVAIVKRGTLSFAEKIFNAQDAGAIAVLIQNNNTTDDIFSFGMQIYNDFGEYPYIPAALIGMEDGNTMAAAEDKTMTVSAEEGIRQSETGGQMSSFSSWGVSPDLSLEPDLTGIGGSVLSCLDGGTYGLMSGTSMSSPQVAGVTALVMQRLKELYPNAPDGTIRNLAEAMLMSTADPIVDNNTGVESSPRQQGAGLVDAYEAVTAETYLTVNGESPKAELGDSANGKYTFSFEIHNISDEAKTYTFDSSLLTEDVLSEYGEYWMAGYDMALSGSVTFDKESVTVPAGGKKNVQVTIQLSAEDKAYFEQYWENGGYVEGFVYLNTETEDGALVNELNLPFLGFYGDWTKAPMFDTAYWYDNSMWDVGDGVPEGDEFWHIFWTSLLGSEWVLGFNPYSGALIDENGDVIYDESNNVVSPNRDGAIDGLEDVYLSLLRNAKTLTMTYTVDGQIVHRETMLNNTKTMFLSNYGQVVPWIYSWYGEGMYDFAGLESGTEVILTIDATVDYGTGGDHSISLPIYVDIEAPEMVSVKEIEVDGTYYMAVTASDDVSLASIVLMNASGSRIYDQVYDNEGTVKNADGTYTAYFDVTGLGTEFMVAVCDYGCNEGYYEVTYTGAGNNLPDMTDYENDLFAYRVFDADIYSDHMYGWISMNKPEASTEDAENFAEISVWTDDYLEYAAINAAEYVDGKVFAVDAVYNLVVMDPGLFDRHTICNLGMNVLDMSFDDSTDTMYVLTKQDSYVALHTMDLLTGELTQIHDYGYYYYAPFAIADNDNGTLYAIKYAGANIYTLSADNDWAMVTVNDADGNAIVITDSTGSNTMPQYAQGLTYADGNLYWAYYKYSYYGGSSELFTINTEDWTYYGNQFQGTAYDMEGNLVEYNPITEMVGLLTLTETDYQIPESNELSKVLLSTDSLLMKVGDTATVTASPLPWNYNVQEMTWTSSDESIATVTDGKIVAVGEGTATITVKADGAEASLEVTAILVEGHFNAYNYYSYDGYYGYMIDVDMETMDYTLDAAAPVDFIAGDYNGHDGCFYGYTENCQLYKWDMEENEISPIGSVADTIAVDMAYDYSTGLMYGMFTDLNTYESDLRVINMNTGATMTVLDITGTYWLNGCMTLACDSNGSLYTLDYAGNLYVVDTETYGMGYGPFYESLGSAEFVQSMCWDYDNEVLIWANCDGNSVNWIDVQEGYMLQLGDPTESGLFEFVGLYTVPETIPALPYVPVENVEANDMLLLVGGKKAVDATVYPFNATNQTLELTSADETVATVANGIVTGVGEGETTISYRLADGENVLEGSINVTVLQGADNVYGHILADLAYGSLQAWAQIYPEDTQHPTALAYTDYVLFAEEYVDGKLYAYGYDPTDWTANWQYFVLNPNSYAIESMTDLGEGFPFVYDMTFDYATGTMYAVAGASEDEMNLYVANIETGAVTLLKQTEQNFMSIAAAEDGMLYAIENSTYGVIGYDEWGFEIYGSTNAQLYSINSKTLEISYVGDTGMICNMIASMAYDHDTGVMYWTPLGDSTSGLAIVDLETGAATNLGTIGPNGAQVSGLYIVADEYPAVDTSELYNVIMNPTKESLNIGDTLTVSMNTIPMNLDGAKITWSSSNKQVATVDENGNVTALAQGKAIISASVTYNGKTMTGECSVAVLAEDAAFLSWNRTDMGWSAISRAGYSVTNLTEGEEVGVSAVASVGATVYGYDENNTLFQLNTETYERTAIGESQTENAINGYLSMVGDESTYSADDLRFAVRDMAYDAANERMLVLGAVVGYTYYEEFDMESYEELFYGCSLYEVDLTTGALTELYNFAEYVYVYSLACAPNGTVYFYTTFDDCIYKLNIENKTVLKAVSLQTQSLYGEYGYELRQAMHYDDLTDTLYMTFTSNGKYYRMLTIDAVTSAITAYNEAGNQMYIGEVVYNSATWSYNGDLFSGLVFAHDNVEAPAFCPSAHLVDVSEDAWYHESVDYVVENGLMVGVDDTHFDPNGQMTRGQFITVLYRMAGSPDVSDVKMTFKDVQPGKYYADAVAWGVSNGIVSGRSETVFAPDASLSRQDMVTFLYRYASYEGYDVTGEADLSNFTDANKVSSYAKDAMEWAVANGIIYGTGNNKLEPAASATRAQGAAILYRLIQK